MTSKRPLILGAYTVILIAVILMWRTLWVIGYQKDLSYYTVSSVILELIFIILIAYTYIDIIKNGRSRRIFVKLFLWMLAITTIGMLGDVLAWGIGLENFAAASALREIGHFFRDAMGFPLIVIYNIYLISYINEEPAQLKRYAYLVGGLCADGLLLVVISRIIAHDPVNPWYLSDHPWLFFIFLAAPIVVSYGIIFYFRHMLTGLNTVAFIWYPLLVLGATALDTVIPELSVAYSAVSFLLLRIYVGVQLEYEKHQEDELTRQRISIMLSQIQPHFIYNVLTGIRTLCRIEPRKAEEALLDFTSYLRVNLGSLTDCSCVPFVQELDHTSHYLKLEKMRYGDDLEVVFDTPVTDFALPTLTLEPIVENAVRHGVMQRETGGTVFISTSEQEQCYLITVRDNGVGFNTDTLNKLESSHVGVMNVRERLLSMCGGNLEIKSVPDEGTTVVISIPK